MKVLCKYNNPDEPPVGISGNFNYGLELNNQYLVMGIIVHDHGVSYLLDKNSTPSFFPSQLFDIVDNTFPPDWGIMLMKDSEYIYSITCICGYKELVEDENYYYDLLLAEGDARSIYFMRKSELENYYKDLEDSN